MLCRWHFWHRHIVVNCWNKFCAAHYGWSFSLPVLMAIFPGEPRLAGFIEAKDERSGGDNWSYKTCKAPVKSSPPINQHPMFYRPNALPVAQPTVSKHWREKISHSKDLLTPSSSEGLPTLSLTTKGRLLCQIFKTKQAAALHISYWWESFCRSWWHSGRPSPRSSGSVWQRRCQRIHPSASAEHRRGSADWTSRHSLQRAPINTLKPSKSTPS